MESRGKAVRLQHLTPIPQGRSLEELSTRLLAQIDGELRRPRSGRKELIGALFDKELPFMLDLNAQPFEHRATMVASVYNNSKVRVQNGWYSVPTTWARTEVTALVGVNEVELCQRDHSVVHPRRTPRCSTATICSSNAYAKLPVGKPGTFRQARLSHLLRLLVCTYGCSGEEPRRTAIDIDSEPLPEHGLNILFIGNSLTYANNLPEMLSPSGGWWAERWPPLCYTANQPCVYNAAIIAISGVFPRPSR